MSPLGDTLSRFAAPTLGDEGSGDNEDSENDSRRLVRPLSSPSLELIVRRDDDSFSRSTAATGWLDVWPGEC